MSTCNFRENRLKGIWLLCRARANLYLAFIIRLQDFYQTTCLFDGQCLKLYLTTTEWYKKLRWHMDRIMRITDYNINYQKMKPLRAVQWYHCTINFSLIYSYEYRGPHFLQMCNLRYFVLNCLLWELTWHVCTRKM